MGLLTGDVRKILYSATRDVLPLLDVTITKQSVAGFDPATGSGTPSTADSVIVKAGFPDTAMDDYKPDGLVPAGHRRILLLQQPLVDAGVEVEIGDRLTMRGFVGEIVGPVAEDPAEATIECVVRGPENV